MNNPFIVQMTVKASEKLKQTQAVEKIDKDLALQVIDALLRADADTLDGLLGSQSTEEKIKYLTLAGEVIDDTRLDMEDEILEKGDVNEVEQLRELIEAEDKAMAEAIKEFANKSQAQQAA